MEFLFRAYGCDSTGHKEVGSEAGKISRRRYVLVMVVDKSGVLGAVVGGGG